MNYTEYLSCNGQSCFEYDKFVTDFLNGVVNHVAYKGLSIEQRPEVLDTFIKLINTMSPKYIVEIGTFAGGLSLLLNDITTIIHSNILTYDINKQEWLIEHVKKHNLLRLKVYTKNIFNSSYDSILDLEMLDLFKNTDDPILVLCDGGNKKGEFNALAQYLKSGDIIMAHDYAPNAEYFEQHMKNKIWNWHEIQDSDIIDSCEKYGLKPYMREEFLSVAWCCFKKE